MRRPSGFPDEILLTWTPSELRRRALQAGNGRPFPTDLGYFPRASGHFRSRPQGCDQHIVLLCLEGRGTVQIGSQEWGLAAGEAVVIPAGEPHGYRADTLQPWTLQWVQRTGDLPPLSKGKRRLSGHVVARAKDHFSDLLALASRDGLEVETSLALGWWLALVLADPPLAPLPGVVVPSPVADAVRWMSDRLAEPLTVAALAAVARLSPSRFNAVFRRETGSSPMGHLQRLRIQKAQALLERTTLGVAEVGRLVGYDDPLHFSRVFRRATGVPPREWRRDPRG